MSELVILLARTLGTIMTPEMLIGILLSVIGGLSALLMGLLAFIGVRLHKKVDEIPQVLSEINFTLSAIKDDLKEELSNHDVRLTALETKCDLYHSSDT